MRLTAGKQRTPEGNQNALNDSAKAIAAPAALAKKEEQESLGVATSAAFNATEAN